MSCLEGVQEGPRTAAGIANLLRGFGFRFSSESQLQAGIAEALERHGLDYRREARLTERDRPDFLCGDVAIEVKTDGSANDLLRQCTRYCGLPSIRELVVVVSQRYLETAIPATLRGKPVVVVNVRGRLW